MHISGSGRSRKNLQFNKLIGSYVDKATKLKYRSIAGLDGKRPLITSEIITMPVFKTDITKAMAKLFGVSPASVSRARLCN